MFKGFTEKLRNKVEEYNQKTDYFIFNVSDLEYSSDRKQGEYKFSIFSSELKQKLGNIFASNGGKITNPTSIRFLKLPPWLKSNGTGNYDSWIKIDKKFLVELNKDKEGRLIELPSNKTEQKFEIGCIRFTIHRLNQKLKFTDDLDILNDIDEAETKAKEARNRSVFKVGGGALKEINQTLSECSIDIETAEIDWMDILPNWCSCEVKEFGNQENNDLYRLHISSCLWRDENEIIAFKNKMIEAIKQGKERFDNYNKEVVKEIVEKAEKQNISEKELNTTRPNWQNTLRSLRNRAKITSYQTTQLEKDIESLVSAKNKSAEERQQAETAAKEKAQEEEERLKKEQEQREAEEKKKQEQETKKQAEEQAKQQELNQKRNQVISEITLALGQEPPLSNSDLSPQYQDWEEQINQLTDIQSITNLQDRILADIHARRQEKKSAQEVKENLHKVKTGTKEEKEEAWKDLEKQETEKGYNDNKEEVEKLKKEKAKENPQKYSEESKKRIEKKLKDNEVKEEELSEENQQEWQKLKNGEIKDPEQLVATETKIKQNIYQVEVNKKITNLTSQVNQVLKSPSPSQIAALKKKLLEFISSSNIYYSAQREVVEKLLTQLENCSTSNTNQNNSSNSTNSPEKIVVFGLLIIIPLSIFLLIWIKKVAKGKKK